MYQTVLFDLDGTLTDPGEGITNSVAYALEHWNIHVEDKTTLYRFIGPPLLDSFQMFYGFTPEQAQEGLRLYREYFSDRGIFQNAVYPGIEKLLKTLHERGVQVVMATSKPEVYAVQILEHFGLDKYFTVMAGASMDTSRNKKSAVIAYALERAGVTDRRTAVMVGDRHHDIEGAAENGLDSIGVLFGYGSEEELRKAGATYIAETVEDILPLLG